MAGDLIPGDDGRLFCFTPIKHRTGNCRDRSAPDGYWKSTKKRTVIHNDEGRSVGFVQDLCYHHGKRRTKWLMKEYTLVGDLPKMALCVIYCAQNKCKDRIQGNEWRMKPNCLDNAPSFNQWSRWNKPHEAIDSESEDTRLPYLSYDLSSLGRTTKDECHQYLKSVAAKTGESYHKIVFMALNLAAAEVAQKFGEPEERVGPSKTEGAFTFESSQGSPSPTATSVGYVSGGEGCSGSSSVADVSDWPLDVDLDFLDFGAPLQESPSVAPFKEGELAEAPACPGMLPDTCSPETNNWYVDGIEDGPDKKTCS
ncbi:uncharacterized protein LOC103697255 isoform X2 [Phoenix dactylifera]|uniref:Uncharacterized protein LOC103697255 isoform X2 n=1 Tax=Phoenix dactylifera TaxID=42345 RepID=A0A8B8ZPV2_PHODC|nr:uncharacterized protein LOC103697255 isoform X2 [Phoenix dactylifera]